MEGEHYASGNWLVAAGNEDEFLARWRAFLEWTRDSVPGFQTAMLIQDTDNPRHFISLAHWDSAEQRAAWKTNAGFREKMGACRALCDDMSGSDYTEAVSIA